LHQTERCRPIWHRHQPARPVRTRCTTCCPHAPSASTSFPFHCLFLTCQRLYLPASLLACQFSLSLSHVSLLPLLASSRPASSIYSDTCCCQFTPQTPSGHQLCFFSLPHHFTIPNSVSLRPATQTKLQLLRHNPQSAHLVTHTKRSRGQQINQERRIPTPLGPSQLARLIKRTLQHQRTRRTSRSDNHQRGKPKKPTANKSQRPSTSTSTSTSAA
ncbi:hypothetical protein BGZ61DRAFT_6569, partial [Ilyonectria robusta]|uniref:uncharacterized protein n=1 Tax=Ilyonectria robusta TaxID=1079257 RepID=UPI001E8D592A